GDGTGPRGDSRGGDALVVGGGPLRPRHHAGDREDEPDDQVGDPGVVLPEHGVGQVDVEQPDGGDGQQDRHGEPDDRREGAVDDPAGGGDGRTGGLVPNGADHPLDRVGGLGRPVGRVDDGPRGVGGGSAGGGGGHGAPR